MLKIWLNEALDKVIEKEKSLIYRSFADTTKDEKCDGGDGGTNVWWLMLKEIEEDNLDVLEAFKIYILYYLNIKCDKVFRAIMKTLVLAREGDGMNFEEALDFAVNTNRYLISQAITKVKRLDSPMTSPYQQPGLIYTWQFYIYTEQTFNNM